MALTFEGVGATLDGRPVLAGIDAALAAGRVTAILGPNGAGKSTLVKAAAALLPIAGVVRVEDAEVARLDPRERARTIGYLPQDATVHWNMAVREVVALGRLPHRRAGVGPSAIDDAAIDRAMAETGTTGFAGRRIGTLSGGERARVLLARVLAGEPRWLLADEPLASLDPAHQIDLLARLAGIAAGGAGVVVVLHDLIQAARAADDVLLLDRGRIAAFGPAEAVLTPERIAAVFGVRVAMIAEGGRRLPVPIGLVSPA
jgi:iron complex transport system ATP-binding protein